MDDVHLQRWQSRDPDPEVRGLTRLHGGGGEDYTETDKLGLPLKILFKLEIAFCVLLIK